MHESQRIPVLQGSLASADKISTSSQCLGGNVTNLREVTDKNWGNGNYSVPKYVPPTKSCNWKWAQRYDESAQFLHGRCSEAWFHPEGWRQRACGFAQTHRRQLGRWRFILGGNPATGDRNDGKFPGSHSSYTAWLPPEYLEDGVRNPLRDITDRNWGEGNHSKPVRVYPPNRRGGR